MIVLQCIVGVVVWFRLVLLLTVRLAALLLAIEAEVVAHHLGELEVVAWLSED